MKNVLVIGNGYDLAHGLKTSYGDFLSFVINFDPAKYEVPQEVETEFGKLIHDNPFIRYFWDFTETLNTWVDFENELKNITYAVRDFFMSSPLDKESKRTINQDHVSRFSLKVLEQLGFVAATERGTYQVQPSYYDPIYNVHWDKIKTKFRSDLDGLKRALVIYLKYYMPLISVQDSYCIKQLADIDPYYVFTFNYTDTYTRYGIANDNSKSLHVHGDLQAEKIVLGYDDEDQEDLRLITFKKYFQRIQYQLRRINKEIFVSTGEKSNDAKRNFDTIAHIYGMSLDKTDEDIIRQIYQLAIQMVIYYYVKEGDMTDYENKVVNLIGILGKEEFLNALEAGKIIFRKIDNAKVE